MSVEREKEIEREKKNLKNYRRIELLLKSLKDKARELKI